MAFEKGKSGNPAGRPKGRNNKLTGDVREAYRQIIEGNLNNLQKWIKEIAKESPFRAAQLLIKLSDYVLPKLQSIEFKDMVENLSDEDINKLSEVLMQKLKSNENL